MRRIGLILAMVAMTALPPHVMAAEKDIAQMSKVEAVDGLMRETYKMAYMAGYMSGMTMGFKGIKVDASYAEEEAKQFANRLMNTHGKWVLETVQE